MSIARFFECGGCEHYHPLGFGGDCREDAKRYNLDDFGNMVNPFNEGYREGTFEIVEEDFEPQKEDDNVDPA